MWHANSDFSPWIKTESPNLNIWKEYIKVTWKTITLLNISISLWIQVIYFHFPAVNIHMLCFYEHLWTKSIQINSKRWFLSCRIDIQKPKMPTNLTGLNFMVKLTPVYHWHSLHVCLQCHGTYSLHKNILRQTAILRNVNTELLTVIVMRYNSIHSARQTAHTVKAKPHTAC